MLTHDPFEITFGWSSTIWQKQLVFQHLDSAARMEGLCCWGLWDEWLKLSAKGAVRTPWQTLSCLRSTPRFSCSLWSVLSIWLQKGFMGRVLKCAFAYDRVWWPWVDLCGWQEPKVLWIIKQNCSCKIFLSPHLVCKINGLSYMIFVKHYWSSFACLFSVSLS